MEKIRPILYGVADYAQLRKKNAWFVDRTAKIRDLEDALPPGRSQDGGSPYGEPPSRRLTGTTDVSSVALHRLVLVFHGGDCVLSEEV